MRIRMSAGGVATVPTSGGEKTVRHNQVLEISVADWNALDPGMRAVFDVLTPHAGMIDFVPAGNLAATTVQDALAELDAEKAAAGGSTPKHRRVSTGALAAGASADVVVAWAVAFADANYTSTVTILDAAARIRGRLLSQVAASITVRVTNEDAVNAAVAGTINAIAIHD